MQNRDSSHPASGIAVPDFTPVPRQRDRHDGWSPERQRAFVEALADSGSVKHAARSVGMAPEGAYQLRRQPGAEEFAAAWETALDHAVRKLEDVALDRAVNGVEVPVYSYGKLVGTRIVHNDRLLMFLLRNRAPERFAANAMRRNEPSPKEVEQLRQQWEKEKMEEEAKKDEETWKKLQAELKRVRKRMEEARTEDEQLFAVWKEALHEGRAVIVPRKDGEEPAKSDFPFYGLPKPPCDDDEADWDEDEDEDG